MDVTNSRAKGVRGELEWAAVCRAEGYDARRGQQHRGGADSPDVIVDMPFYFEVKRTERLSIYPAMQQAEGDAPAGIPPVVTHRRNNHDWIVSMKRDDWFELVRKALG